MSTQQWKSEILDRWSELDLSGYCLSIGISYEDSFLTPLMSSTSESNPFAGSTFTWLANSIIATGVLHLHPDKKPTEATIWEEWFIHTDGLHHHVLHNFEIANATDSWLGKDLDHPAQVCNVQWHLYNDVDLRPIALR
jgi:hypothetical protein